MSLWGDLKNRKLVQWTLAYLAGAWMVTQVVDIIVEPWGLSTGFVRGTQVVLVVGFFVALVLAWYHGEQGRQRVSGPELLIIATLLAIGGGVVALLGPSEIRDEAEGVAQPIASVPRDDGPSVAALPFTSTRSDEESVDFAVGIHDAVLMQLGRVPGLRSVSRTSVQRYRETDKSIPEIASELGVTAVLEAMVQRAGEAIRFSVTLYDGVTERVLWSREFQRTYTAEEVFAIQAAIVSEVGAGVGAALTDEDMAAIAEPPTTVTEAYTAFLDGLAHDQRSVLTSEAEAAVASYKRAVALDPGFGRAWARLSSAWSWLIWAPNHGGDPSGWPEVVAAADSAQRLSPESPDTYVALGLVAYRRDADYATATRLFETGLAIEERSDVLLELSTAQKRLGRWEEGLRSLRRAVELDPLSDQAWYEMRFHALALGQYEEAQRASSRASTLAPEGHTGYANSSLQVLLLLGDTIGARRYDIVHEEESSWRAALDGYLDGDFTTVADFLRSGPRGLGNQLPLPIRLGPYGAAMLYSKAGDEVAARALTDSMATVYEDSLRVADDEGDRIAVTRNSIGLAQARALLGDSDATSDMEEALRAYRELDRLRYELGWVIRVAATYSLLGDTDGALRHIETCLRDTPATCSAAWLRIDPWWDYLRDDQRFEELLERYDRN